MLKDITDRFCNGSKFINNIDKLNTYLDSKKMTDEEKANILLEVYNYNLKVLSKIKEENKKLKQVSSVESLIIESKELPIIEDAPIPEGKKLSIHNVDVSSYMSKINEADSIDDLTAVISSYDIEKNTDTINVIILKLTEDIIDIKKMLYHERKSIDSDTKDYFENAIGKLQSKVDFFRNLNKHINNNLIEKEDSFNELVFLSTNCGNVCIYQDLKDIPSEQYDIFLTLLDSIRTGKFTNLRTFNNNNALKDLREVKYGPARIVFRQIASNCYAIIYMFVKKVNKDAYYHLSIANRHDLFLQNVDNMTMLANTSEDYLEENRMILEDVRQILSEKNKVKKIGDING